jgi:DNA-binding transcriptional MerR regulator
MSQTVDDDEPARLYYSIGEVAEMLDLAPSVIRFWEKEVQVLKPKKSSRGNRLFTHQDIENLRLIKHLLKEKGYTIAGANDYLKKEHRLGLEKIKLLDELKEMRTFLQQMKDQLP